MNSEKYGKLLRQKIMASASIQGFSSEEFHQMLEDWGFGNSLRKLRIGELKQVRALTNGWDYEKKEYGLGELDKQGRYAWSLMKKAGWDWARLQKLILTKNKATHWNALDQTEKRGIINIMKTYAQKAEGK